MIERFLPYSPDRDVYRLLQVDPRAPTDEILEAWRHLARAFHPDHNGSGRATEEMQVVNAVRELLTDPAARAAYDRARQRWIDGDAEEWTRPAGNGTLRSRPGPGGGRGSGHLPGQAGSPVQRTARALGLGLRAFAVELLPRRCERCRGTVGRRDERCWICGFPTSVPRLP